MAAKSRGILETYNCLVRYKEIIAILAEYGYKDLVMNMGLNENASLKETLGEKFFDSIIPRVDGTRAERFRMLIEALGTTFIKFGQILSTRPDLLPKEYCHELKKLQDKVPPFPDEVAREAIEKELGHKIEEMFTSFSEHPVASASIAQVYKGVLPGGETVAVKVRRPDIERTIAADLAIMDDLAHLLERRVPESRPLQPVALVEEFGRGLQNETNFLMEAHNLERFNGQNEGRTELRLVNLHRDLSTSRVLTMEFMTGTKISETEKLQSLNVNLKDLASRGARVILSQIFEQGFFHGDPHPGNILVQDDGRICFLDFGVMGKLNLDQRMALAEMLVAVARRDDEKLLSGVLELAVNGDDIKDRTSLGRDISEFVDKYAYLPLNRLKVEEILNDLLSMLTGHGLRLPPECYTLIKVLATLEGTGAALDKDFQILEEIKPYAQKLLLMKYNPARLAKDMTHTTAELYRLMRELPDDIRTLFKTINKAEVKVNLGSNSLKLFLRAFTRDANRLSFALIVSALLLSSSVVLHAHIAPCWYHISILGLLGIIISGCMGVWLLIAIARSGHL